MTSCLPARRESTIRIDKGFFHAQLSWVLCVSDYHLASPALAEAARSATIFKDIKFSDHAPLTIDYDFQI